MTITSDVIIVGGGIVGASIALGIAENGFNAVMLDEGDIALRAATGNFGLVWFHGKGLGMRRYAEWSLEATVRFPNFANHLLEKTGIDVQYKKSGGLTICISEREMETNRKMIDQLRRESPTNTYDCEMIDRQAIAEMLPGITLGRSVVGASYSRHDGHLNPLLLLKAAYGCFKRAQGRFFPNHPVCKITPDKSGFLVETANAFFSAPKVVLACGLGIVHLMKMVKLNIPVRPEKGQILVSERCRPILPIPLQGIRQTDNGSILLGSSNESVGLDTSVTPGVIRRISQRAIKAFPVLEKLRLVRCWTPLRTLTPGRNAGLPRIGIFSRCLCRYFAQWGFLVFLAFKPYRTMDYGWDPPGRV